MATALLEQWSHSRLAAVGALASSSQQLHDSGLRPDFRHIPLFQQVVAVDSGAGVDSQSVAKPGTTVAQADSGVAVETQNTSGPVHVYSGVPDDTTDLTADIQAFLDAIPSGTEQTPITIRFPIGKSQGKYRVEGTIRVTNKAWWNIEGPSKADPATFHAHNPGTLETNGYSQRQHLSFYDVTDFNLRYLRVEGPNTELYLEQADIAKYRPEYEFEHAFDFRGDVTGCLRCVVEDCEVFNIYGDGLYVGKLLFRSAHCHFITFQNTLIKRQGRQGAAVVAGTNFVFDNLEIYWGRRSGIDLEPNSQTPEGLIDTVLIQNCTVRAENMLFGAPNSFVKNVTIDGNTFLPGLNGDLKRIQAIITLEGDVTETEALENRANWVITNNTWEGSWQNGAAWKAIVVRYVENVTISGNTIAAATDFHNRGKPPAFLVEKCAGSIVVEDNTTTNFNAPVWIVEPFWDWPTTITASNNTFGGGLFHAGVEEAHGADTGTVSESESVVV